MNQKNYKKEFLKETFTQELQDKEYLLNEYYIKNLNIDKYERVVYGGFHSVKAIDIFKNALTIQSNSYEAYLFNTWLMNLKVVDNDDRNFKKIMLVIEPIFDLFLTNTFHVVWSVWFNKLSTAGFKGEEDFVEYTQKTGRYLKFNITNFIQVYKNGKTDEINYRIKKLDYKDCFVEKYDVENIIKSLLNHNDECCRKVINDKSISQIIDLNFNEGYPYSISVDVFMMEHCEC